MLTISPHPTNPLQNIHEELYPSTKYLFVSSVRVASSFARPSSIRRFSKQKFMYSWRAAKQGSPTVLTSKKMPLLFSVKDSLCRFKMRKTSSCSDLTRSFRFSKNCFRFSYVIPIPVGGKGLEFGTQTTHYYFQRDRAPVLSIALVPLFLFSL